MRPHEETDDRDGNVDPAMKEYPKMVCEQKWELISLITPMAEESYVHGRCE